MEVQITTGGRSRGMRTVALVSVLFISAIVGIPVLRFTGSVAPSVSAVEYPISGWEDDSYYVNTGFVNTWVRINGSDVGFPIPYEGTPPCLAANWFRSQTYTPKYQDYSFENLTDADYWGDDPEFYIYAFSGVPVVSYMNAVADAAVDNPNIKGAVWDDFRVSQESPANVSAVYSALHHEDENLTQGDLKLIIVVYERDYFDQTPYTWASIQDYYDGVSYWFYPDSYSSLWSNFYGYEDGFFDMRSLCGVDKEYWVGIYLHYYNLGSFPYELTYEQMGVGLRLIDLGYATQLHVLENQHIRANPETSALVKSYLDTEYAREFVTTFDGTEAITTVQGVECESGIWGLEQENQYASGGWRFHSLHYQLMVFDDQTYTDPHVQEVITGQFIRLYSSGPICSFWAEPNREYRIYDKTYTSQTISTRQTITTETTWEDKEITLNAQVHLNSTLTINNCVIHWGHYNYFDSVKNATTPKYGLTVNTDGVLRVMNSTIEPILRELPYYLNMTNETYLGNKECRIYNSTIVGFAGTFHPTNYVYIYDSVFGLSQTNGGSAHGFYIICPSRVNRLMFVDNICYNHFNAGSYNFFMLGGGATSDYVFNGNTFAGGEYVLRVDGSSGSSITRDFHNTTLCKTDGGASTIFSGSGTGTGIYRIYTRTVIETEAGDISGTLKSYTGASLSAISTDSEEEVETLYVTWSYAGGYTYATQYPYSFVLSDHEVTSDSIVCQMRPESGALYSARFGWMLLPFDDATVTINQGIARIAFLSDVGVPQNMTFDVNVLGGVSFSDMYAGSIEPLVPLEWAGLCVRPSIEVTLREVVSNADTVLAWTTNETSASITYTMTGLLSDWGYRVYKDDVVIATGTGPSFSFSSIGGGEFEIEVWHSKRISVLVVLAVNMVGLGIFVSVIVGWIMPFSRKIKDGGYRSANQMMRDLVKGVVFIIVALLMWGLLQHIAIG